MNVIVTGMGPAGYKEYGHRFLDTFDTFWPKHFPLICYIEELFPTKRAELRSVWSCDGASEFVKRHKDNPVHGGRAPNPRWPQKDIGKPYSFRFDAVKFFRQIMIPNHAAGLLPDGTILTWLDADVVTYRAIPHDLLENLIGDSDLSYLGRKRTHSEIGYWSVKLNPKTRAFLKDMADVYRTDAVFKLKEWHSAYVFDQCRHRFEAEGGKSKNLTPDGFGHVWFQSPLGGFADHLKGRRKQSERSAERV